MGSLCAQLLKIVGIPEGQLQPDSKTVNHYIIIHERGVTPVNYLVVQAILQYLEREQ
jgi:hypothetical protein